MILLLACLLAYLMGSIPFGLLLTKAAGLGDVRAIGSGNIGATNVLRTGHKGLAALTLVLDGAKGYVAFYATAYLLSSWAMDDAVGLFLIWVVPVVTVLGHMFPVWLKFKGGKGVATAFGITLFLLPAVGAVGLALWLATFMVTRISSLSALISINAIPFIALAAQGIMAFVPLFVIALLITWRHKDNIKRLLAGTEPTFGKKP